LGGTQFNPKHIGSKHGISIVPAQNTHLHTSQPVSQPVITSKRLRSSTVPSPHSQSQPGGWCSAVHALLIDPQACQAADLEGVCVCVCMCESQKKEQTKGLCKMSPLFSRGLAFIRTFRPVLQGCPLTVPVELWRMSKGFCTPVNKYKRKGVRNSVPPFRGLTQQCSSHLLIWPYMTWTQHCHSMSSPSSLTAPDPLLVPPDALRYPWKTQPLIVVE
jgi:hypothetical protein